MLRLQLAQLSAGDHVGHRTAGGRVGNEHRLVGIENRCRLGHEVDAAEDDHVGVDLGGAAREFEGIARVVGDVLDLAAGVVVRKDNGLALFLESFDFSFHRIFRKGSAFNRQAPALVLVGHPGDGSLVHCL